MERPSGVACGAVEGGVGVLHAGCCQHAGFGRSDHGGARARPADSCAHLVGRVVLTRSLRRLGGVHECFVHRGEGGGGEGGRRRALHDPIVLPIVEYRFANETGDKGGPERRASRRCSSRRSAAPSPPSSATLDARQMLGRGVRLVA